MEPIFLLIASFFILSIVLNGVKRRKQQEEMQRKRAEYEHRNAAKETVSVHTQSSPAAQNVPARPATPIIRTDPPKNASSRSVTVMESSVPNRKKPSAKAAAAAYDMHRTPPKQTTAVPRKPAAASAPQPLLQWDRNSAVQGIVYAEILGKPKALRRK